MFLAALNEPGEVSVAIWDDARDSYRTPTAREVDQIERHPLTNRIRVDLVLAAGKTWPDWAPYAQMLLGLLSQRRVSGAT